MKVAVSALIIIIILTLALEIMIIVHPMAIHTYRSSGVKKNKIWMTGKTRIGKNSQAVSPLYPSLVYSIQLRGSILTEDNFSQQKLKTHYTGDKKLDQIQRIKLEFGTIRGVSPPKSGNWIINATTVIEQSRMIINGSIIVEKNGALILRNTSIYMNLSYDGEYHLDVYGNLTILDSLITAYNTSNNYYIRVFSGAKLLIKNSEISYAGYEANANGEYSGVWINTKNATITNTEIHHNYCGVWINTKNATITNTEIHHNYRGIYLYKGKKIKIYGATIQNNGYGVYLFSSNDSDICGNIIQNNGWIGILLDRSSNNDICGNIIQDNRAGIRLYYSSNNNLCSNIIQNNCLGLRLIHSSNNKICGNIIQNNILEDMLNGLELIISDNNNILYNTFIVDELSTWNSSNNNILYNTFIRSGLFVWNSYNNTIKNNTVNQKELVYLENADKITIDKPTGQIILVNSKNVIIKNQNISNTPIGIELWNTTKTTIKDSTIKDSYCGINLIKSNNNSIYNNTIKNNSYGTFLGFSNNNKMQSNAIKNNNYGLVFAESNNNSIYNNTIKNNNYGVYFWCKYGYHYSNSNRIFLNNFIDNIHQTNSFDKNQWITAKSIEYTYNKKTYNNKLGNYWSDYNGTDNNEDGVGDTPYGNDTAPLIQPTWKYKFHFSRHSTASNNQNSNYIPILTLGIIGATTIVSTLIYKHIHPQRKQTKKTHQTPNHPQTTITYSK